MGEISKYYVPHDENQFIGKERDVAEAFWNLGIFLVTKDRFVYQRIKEWKERGQSLPVCKHNFSFAEMGLGGSKTAEPVPNSIYDLICPNCSAGITDQAYEIWNDDESVVPLPDRTIRCPECGTLALSSNLRTLETPFTFAKFYLWISDIEESDWESSFKNTVEIVLGPCREFTAWET